MDTLALFKLKQSCMSLSCFLKMHFYSCLFHISINAQSSGRWVTLHVDYFFLKIEVILTLFEGLNSGTFTDEIIFKIVSSDKSYYGFEEK